MLCILVIYVLVIYYINLVVKLTCIKTKKELKKNLIPFYLWIVFIKKEFYLLISDIRNHLRNQYKKSKRWYKELK